jgi:hypothetical protein
MENKKAIHPLSKERGILANKINEGISSVLYHFLTLETLIKVIKTNRLGGEYGQDYVSFSRTRQGGYNEGINRHVRIQFDGEKLATRYKGRPIDYSKGSKNPQNTLGYEGQPLNFEYEDQIVNVPKGIQNVFNYIVRVDILLNDNENPSSRYNNDRDEDYTTDNRLNFIINTEYYREGVIIFYDNYKDWDNQTMNTINPEEYLKESLANKIKKEMGLL